MGGKKKKKEEEEQDSLIDSSMSKKHSVAQTKKQNEKHGQKNVPNNY